MLNLRTRTSLVHFQLNLLIGASVLLELKFKSVNKLWMLESKQRKYMNRQWLKRSLRAAVRKEVQFKVMVV